MADGDREALGELYDTHADALFGHALVLTRRRQDAEDLVQDVFVKLTGLGAALLGIRGPGAYLHRMLRTAFVDRERHRGVVAEAAASSTREPGGVSEGKVDDADRMAINAAVEALPLEQREVVLLHVVEGLTFREVAAQTGAAMWTVASRYRPKAKRRAPPSRDSSVN